MRRIALIFLNIWNPSKINSEILRQIKMYKEDLINKINEVLLSVEMPSEIRELLIELRDQIPSVTTPEQNQDIYLRWMEIILTTARLVYEISTNT